MDRQQPFMNRDMRTLHHGASAAGELLAAIVAEEVPGLRLALHTVNLEGAAMRARYFSRPAGGFQMGNGGGFVSELWGGQIGGSGHGNLLCPRMSHIPAAKSSI